MGLAVPVAGCGGSVDGSAAPATATAVPTAAPTRTPPATPAGTPARRTAPRTSTPPPVTVDAPCPYADATTIAETVGQRVARITVTRTSPHVGCAYYRSNGEKAVDVSVSVAASPAAAQARALAVAGGSANPVDGVGDGGAVSVSDAGSLLAVSEGRVLVVVRVNQPVPLEAVEIAKLVVAKL